MRQVRNWGIVALIALAIVVLPAGGPVLNAVLSALSIAFFAAIALFAYRLYREHQFTLDAMTDRQRFVLYASVGAALLTFTATSRLFGAGGIGVLVWLVVLGVCSYGVMWVYMSYRRYN
jgi:hypothetical protein